eukprot:TRINITY_DN5305_c0_g1_i1.p1 TRINITY_DN5305_c0_g1~~TRINITY_DN5305_c0_g1_i1.p1  ORF type:complete len:198 (+),score=39.23 TRINITY_DN5305_c0_g1_i1:70-663(+)
MEHRQTGSGLFGYDWKNGFVSPFQVCPEDTIALIAQEHIVPSGSVVVCDLGCGDGALLRGLQKHTDNCIMFGIELDQVLAVEAARSRSKNSDGRHKQMPRCDILLGDLMDPDGLVATLVCKKVDIVVMFLLPSALKKLSKQLLAFLLESSCSQGNRMVITIGWPIPNFQEQKGSSAVQYLESFKSSMAIYVYRQTFE